MGLTSTATLFVLIGLTVAGVAGTVLRWNRLTGHRPIHLAGRVVLVVGCQLCGLLLAACLVNRQFGFYSAWSDLLGRSATVAAAAPAVTARLDNVYAAQLRTAYAAGHGSVVQFVIPGRASGVPPQRALVYLPAAYGDPSAGATRFPVVEMLHGFPGQPESWTNKLNVQKVLDAAIARHQVVPLIAVMPMQNLAFPRDTQCVDVVGGPKVDTFLSADVHRAVLTAFRASGARHGWAIMGYSTGGYCALNLAMRHPDLFSAAVSLSGYARPAHDFQTGTLFGASIALADANTPLWREQHRPVNLSALLVTAGNDRVPYRDATQLAAAARHPLQLSNVVLRQGGHNFTFWRAVEPDAFGWLSERLAAPLAPILLSTAAEEH